MNVEQLHEAIEAYPRRLAAAMEAVDLAKSVVETLDAHIEDAQARPITMVDLNLDHDLSLLELAYEQRLGEVELEYRRTLPKPTEAAIAAMVRADARLVEAKQACLDKKFERHLFNRRGGYAARYSETATSPELDRLQAELETASIAHEAAVRHLEEVKAELPSYQMLVQLYAAGLTE